MDSLIKLELKKYKFMKYGVDFIIISLVLLVITTLMGATVADGEIMFTTTQSLFEFGDVIIRMIFIIFAGVLLSKLIIGEFKNSTIKIMFTYPISRKKIMGVKLTIVWAFVFVGIILESIIFGVGLRFINNVISITPDTITLGDLTSRYSTILYNAVVTSGLSLISLFFGMRKKSVTTTIVASVILSLFINSTVGSEGFNVFSTVIIPVCFCLFGVMVAVFSYINIDKYDIN